MSTNAAIVTADDFYSPEYRIIFHAILDVFKENSNCDFYSVSNFLINKRFLERSYTNAFAISHAKIIKEHA